MTFLRVADAMRSCTCARWAEPPLPAGAAPSIQRRHAMTALIEEEALLEGAGHGARLRPITHGRLVGGAGLRRLRR